MRDVRPQVIVRDAEGKARRSRLRAIAALILVIFFGVIGFDALLYPWAFSWMRPLTGAPTLVGDWYGELMTPAGRRLGLALDLDAYLGRCRSGGCSRIQAAARTCDAHGVREFEGHGHPRDWRGTRFDLMLNANGPFSEGLNLNFIRMIARREAEAIRAFAELGSIRMTASGTATATIGVDRTGVTRSDANPDASSPVNLLLHRGSDQEFEIACRRRSQTRRET